MNLGIKTIHEGALCAHTSPPNGMVPRTRTRAACGLQPPAARSLQPAARSMQPAACSLQPEPAAYSLQELHEHMRESDAIPNKKQ